MRAVYHAALPAAAVPKLRHDIGGGTHPAGFDLPVAERKDPEQRNRL